MRKKRQAEHENMERWLISYADFITLLFAFFVVMYSTSSVNAGKLRAVADSINAAFNPFIAFSATNIKITREQSATEIFNVDMKLYMQVVAQIKKLDNTGKIKVVKDKRGVTILIADSLLFETGRAAILPEVEPALDQVADYLAKLPNPIQIEGHSDNIPIRTAVYPSNWELSTARATSILRYFVERRFLDPARFSIAGYGEFRPVAPNDTLENRAKNRRVEIVILKRNSNPVPETAEQNGPAAAPNRS